MIHVRIDYSEPEEREIALHIAHVMDGDMIYIDVSDEPRLLQVNGYLEWLMLEHIKRSLHPAIVDDDDILVETMRTLVKSVRTHHGIT